MSPPQFKICESRQHLWWKELPFTWQGVWYGENSCGHFCWDGPRGTSDKETSSDLMDPKRSEIFICCHTRHIQSPKYNRSITENINVVNLYLAPWQVFIHWISFNLPSNLVSSFWCNPQVFRSLGFSPASQTPLLSSVTVSQHSFEKMWFFHVLFMRFDRLDPFPGSKISSWHSLLKKPLSLVWGDMWTQGRWILSTMGIPWKRVFLSLWLRTLQPRAASGLCIAQEGLSGHDPAWTKRGESSPDRIPGKVGKNPRI